jgi:hypothetical protein
MRPRHSPFRLLACLTLASCFAASQCLAAPATSEELSGSQEGRSTATGSGGLSPAANLPVVPAVSQSKSVELLLQLQDQPQQAVGEGRGSSALAKRAAAQASAPGGSPAQTAALPADPNPLANLKNAILRDAAPRQVETNPGSGPSPGAMERLSTPGQPSGASVRREPGQSLLSNPVIQYIRENRAMVLSLSFAVLAGIWLTASFSLRRSR